MESTINNFKESIVERNNDDSSNDSSKSSKSKKSNRSNKSNKSNKSENNFSTTSTNLNFEAFADSQKVIDNNHVKTYSDMKKTDLSDIKEESERKNYESDNSSKSSHSSSSRKKEDLRSYINTEKKKTPNYGSMLSGGLHNNNSHLHSNTHHNKGGNKEGLRDDNGNLLNEEEVELLKLDMIRKLGDLTQYGVKLTDNYSMNSPYKKMKYEYELHMNVRKKKNSIMFMRNTMINLVQGIELFSSSGLNPFSVDLQGWSKVINSEVESYYDVFGEIYEKYNKPGKDTDPLVKLVFMISASAIQYTIGKAMTSMIMPQQLSDNLNNDPEKVEKLRQMAINRQLNEQQNSNKHLDSYMSKQHEKANENIKNRNYLEQKQKEFMNSKLNNLSEMEKMLDQSVSSNNQSPQQYQNQQRRINIPPNMMNNIRNINDPQQQRLMKENMLRQQMLNNQKPQYNPNNLTPQQQQELRNREIQMQRQRMFEMEQKRRQIINEQKNDQNSNDEKSSKTISSKADEAINSFYNNTSEDSAKSNVSLKSKRRKRRMALKVN